MILETTDELVTEYIDNAQVSMLKTLQDQMTRNQEGMKKHMQSEVGIVNNLVDKLKNHVLPENLRMVERKIEESSVRTQSELNECLNYVNDQLKVFRDKVEYFETDVAATQTKFKRLVSD